MKLEKDIFKLRSLIPKVDINDSILDLLNCKSELEKFMKENSTAAGIAANQLGYNLPIFCFKIGNNIEHIINPSITYYSQETIFSSEQCFSLPNMSVQTNRSKKIFLSGNKLVNNEVKNILREFKNMQAVIVQHEFDHLQGVLMLDRAINIQEEKFQNYDLIHKFENDYFIDNQDETIIYKNKNFSKIKNPIGWVSKFERDKN